jgi:hypothetical protein
MLRSARRTAAAVAFVMMASMTIVVAAADLKPSITAATVSADQTTLFVVGENFNSHPIVVRS